MWRALVQIGFYIKLRQTTLVMANSCISVRPFVGTIQTLISVGSHFGYDNLGSHFIHRRAVPESNMGNQLNQCKSLIAITNPCPSFSGSLAKPPEKLADWRIIIVHKRHWRVASNFKMYISYICIILWSVAYTLQTYFRFSHVWKLTKLHQIDFLRNICCKIIRSQ